MDNGQILRDANDEPNYGEMILYICDEGYTLVGSDSIVCTETGQYDSQPPRCEGKTLFTGVKHMTMEVLNHAVHL